LHYRDDRRCLPRAGRRAALPYLLLTPAIDAATHHTLPCLLPD